MCVSICMFYVHEYHISRGILGTNPTFGSHLGQAQMWMQDPIFEIYVLKCEI